MRLIRDDDLPARRLPRTTPGTGGRVIAAYSLARQFDGVVDDAHAAQHGDIWSFLMRRFRVEKGRLAGQGFHGQGAHRKMRGWRSRLRVFSGYDVSTG
jgi:hypothetical protein